MHCYCLYSLSPFVPPLIMKFSLKLDLKEFCLTDILCIYTKEDYRKIWHSKNCYRNVKHLSDPLAQTNSIFDLNEVISHLNWTAPSPKPIFKHIGKNSNMAGEHQHWILGNVHILCQQPRGGGGVSHCWHTIV